MRVKLWDRLGAHAHLFSTSCALHPQRSYIWTRTLFLKVRGYCDGLSPDDIIQGLFIRAGLTRLAWFPRSRHITKSFVKISDCSYERVGWLGCRDLGWKNRDLANRAENFPIWTLQIGHRDETFLTKIASLFRKCGQHDIILPCLYFYFRSLRIFRLSKVKLQAIIVANETTSCAN